MPRPLADLSLPALMRLVRARYARAIQAELLAVGCDDIPEHGAAILGAIARGPTTAGAIAADLMMSKQAMSAIIDTLVGRGYVVRVTDPDDRRRHVLTPTERGRAAAQAARRGVQATDRRFDQTLIPDARTLLRDLLISMIEATDHDN